MKLTQANPKQICIVHLLYDRTVFKKQSFNLVEPAVYNIFKQIKNQLMQGSVSFVPIWAWAGYGEGKHQSSSQRTLHRGKVASTECWRMTSSLEDVPSSRNNMCRSLEEWNCKLLPSSLCFSSNITFLTFGQYFSSSSHNSLPIWCLPIQSSACSKRNSWCLLSFSKKPFTLDFLTIIT